MPVRALVIDDSAYNRVTLARMLESHSQIKVVGTGANVLITTFLNGTMIHDCQTSVGTLATGAAGTYIYGPNTIAEFDDVKIATP